jgi:hypothetical protein
MPGWPTNGLPPISAPVQNGVTVSVDQLNINGTLSGGAPLTYTQLGAAALIPADTESSSGAPPQTVGATTFQIAAHAAPFIHNSATSTSGAATLNTLSGFIQTESLATAPLGTYTMTLTNSLITSGTQAVPQVEMLSLTNTQGSPQINSITNAVGSCVIVFENVGTQAFNGTFAIPFHI